MCRDEKRHLKAIPTVDVGIKRGKKIEFSLSGFFSCNGEQLSAGEYLVEIKGGQLLFRNETATEWSIEPREKKALFTIIGVTIGIDFHWETQRTQHFAGTLIFRKIEEDILVINRVDVETYLTSVISSEMSANASLSLLKAHAIISRSWLLRKLQTAPNSYTETPIITFPDTYITWYESDVHHSYDVCADDHCQRYQGVHPMTNTNALRAVKETEGEVMIYENEICDARFSKCCGGISEEFQYCWADTPLPYLRAVPDTPKHIIRENADDNNESAHWITGNNNDFCSCNDKIILSQVLNDFDLDTPDFYRWQVEYSQEELRTIIARKSGIDFGDILHIVPLKRGKSGRIYQLLIEGSKASRIIGKELIIRRWLSKTHLYSSAFVVERSFATDGTSIPSAFLFRGGGWGHGVGLCQIGAAVMGAQGYDYKQILAHYYKEIKLNKIYG